jgi:hypothetical protein
MTQHAKRTYAILLCQWERLDFRFEPSVVIFSRQHVISIDLYFTPTLLSLNMLKH